MSTQDMEARTPMNIYGLYANVVSRSIIVQRSDRQLDDSSYGLWLVYLDEDGTPYLVDTYHIDAWLRYFGPHAADRFLADRVKALDAHEDDHYAIVHSNTEYYYSGSVKMTPYILEYFRLVCDIRDVEETQQPQFYADDDVITDVKLWKDANRVSLVRKAACVDNDSIVESECDRAMTGSKAPYAMPMPDVTPVSDFSKEYASLTREYLAKLDGMSSEWKAFLDEWRTRREACLECRSQEPDDAE